MCLNHRIAATRHDSPHQEGRLVFVSASLSRGRANLLERGQQKRKLIFSLRSSRLCGGLTSEKEKPEYWSCRGLRLSWKSTHDHCWPGFCTFLHLWKAVIGTDRVCFICIDVATRNAGGHNAEGNSKAIHLRLSKIPLRRKKRGTFRHGVAQNLYHRRDLWIFYKARNSVCPFSRSSCSY
jgi:hypothetical protein